MRRWLASRMVREAVVGSTNDVASALARVGATHGTVVTALAQTRGRGRLGRVWHSPPGRALYLSVVLRPALPPTSVPPITLAAGIAVCDALNHFGARASIKWPNDVQCGTPARKVAGILTEMSTSGDRVQHVILGIGVNVLHQAGDFPPELAGIATSLALTVAAPPTLAAVEERLCDELEGWLDRFFAGGVAAIVPAWRERSSTLGQDVRISGDGAPIEGRAVELAEDGALVVDTAAGRVRVIAGEVMA